MSAAVNSYDEIFGAAQHSAPPINEADAKLPRYVFNPFRTHKLRPHYQSEWGLTNLRHGIIQPILERDRPEIYFEVVKDTQPDDLTASMGVTEMRQRRCWPLRVVEAMIRTYGTHDGVATGFGEIIVLRGMDRPELPLIREIQVFCLPVFADPQIIEKAENQIRYLDSLDFTGKPPIFRQVAENLMERTVLAEAWARQHYDKITGKAEEAAGLGRRFVLSKLAKHVCSWLNLPEPKAQTKLAAAQQSQQSVDIAGIVSQAVTAAVMAVQQMQGGGVAASASPTEPVKITDEQQEFDNVTNGKTQPQKKR